MIELPFADSDSEMENLTLGDDGWVISELAGRGASLHSNGAAVQSEEHAETGRQNRAGHDDDNDGNGGWAYLRDEEVYQEWIKLSDEQTE